MGEIFVPARTCEIVDPHRPRNTPLLPFIQGRIYPKTDIAFSNVHTYRHENASLLKKIFHTLTLVL